MRSLLLLLALLALSLNVEAKTKYVTDQFKITLRSGESSSHRITSMLPSGAPVIVLGTNDQTGYTHVKQQDGKKGYVLTRQLMDGPVARDQLVTLTARIRELEAAPGELTSRLAGLQKEHANLQRAHKELNSIKQEIEQELSTLKRTATNAVRIANERKDLQSQVKSLTRENAELKQDRLELENNSKQRWFLIGAGVLVGGILLGLILPHLRMRRRKDSWGSL